MNSNISFFSNSQGPKPGSHLCNKHKHKHKKNHWNGRKISLGIRKGNFFCACAYLALVLISPVGTSVS